MTEAVAAAVADIVRSAVDGVFAEGAPAAPAGARSNPTPNTAPSTTAPNTVSNTAPRRASAAAVAFDATTSERGTLLEALRSAGVPDELLSSMQVVSQGATSFAISSVQMSTLHTLLGGGTEPLDLAQGDGDDGESRGDEANDAVAEGDGADDDGEGEPLPMSLRDVWQLSAAGATKVILERVKPEQIAKLHALEDHHGKWRHLEEAIGILLALSARGASGCAAVVGAGGDAAAVAAVRAFPTELTIVRGAWGLLATLMERGTDDECIELARRIELELRTGRSEESAAAAVPLGCGECAVECSICLSEIDDPDELVTLDCGHNFCITCTRKHVHSKLAGREDSACRCTHCAEAVHPGCPLCRRPLGPIGILASVRRSASTGHSERSHDQ